MIKNFLRIWFWEFIQNTPFIMAFTSGYQVYLSGNVRFALIIVFTGVAAGALLIRYTEGMIDDSVHESWRETITNIIFFTVAILLFFLYFSWIAASALLDILTGLLVGVAASYLQAAAGRTRPTLAHSSALAISFAIAVLLIRQIIETLTPFQATLLIGLPVTTLIVLIEYRRGFISSTK